MLHQDKAFIVMRELPGVPVYSLVANASLTLHQRFKLSLVLLTALKEQIHDRGYVHRDIKPENILFHPSGDTFTAYIVDYGFMKEAIFDDSLEQNGTAFYAPPEYFLDNTITTDKYDIYSMGRVLMYVWGGYDSEERNRSFTFNREMHSGCPEYRNMFTYIPEKPACSADIAHIIKKMCSVLPVNRPNVDEAIQLFQKLENRLYVSKKRALNNTDFNESSGSAAPQIT
ncbi:MAG: protein kinase [Legionellales bacterium]